MGKESIESRIGTFGDAARARINASFAVAGVTYPPEAVRFVAIKNERMLHIYAGRSPSTLVHVQAYPVLGQSGALGPKLREGDRQVPEGIYTIERLNPNSAYYVSLRLNYPNDWDRQKAREEGRSEPGSDIYIHGKAASVGCLAMGDTAIEELFTLVVDVGVERVRVIIAPVDFRTFPDDGELPQEPAWTETLYTAIADELRGLPAPKH